MVLACLLFTLDLKDKVSPKNLATNDEFGLL